MGQNEGDQGQTPHPLSLISYHLFPFPLPLILQISKHSQCHLYSSNIQWKRHRTDRHILFYERFIELPRNKKETLETQLFLFNSGCSIVIMTPYFQANVSSDEYQKMMTVYRQSVRQTEALRQLRDHFDSHIEQSERFNDIVIYSGQFKATNVNNSGKSSLFVLLIQKECLHQKQDKTRLIALG